MNKLFPVFLLIISHTLFAQNNLSSEQKEYYLGRIVLSVVVMPEDIEKMTASEKAMLENRSLSIATNNGIASTSEESSFILVPKIDVYDEQVSEGMKNITVVRMEYNLSIRQSHNNTVFASYTTKLRGSGFNRNEAVRNAISQIDPADPKARSFIDEGQNKILQFFNSKCKDILAETDKYAAVGDYEHALAILLSVPTEATTCNDEIKAKAFSIFKLYQKKKCASQIQLAKAQAAGKQFVPALTTLGFVDANSSCSAEANALVSSIQSKMSIEEKRQWEMEKERMKNSLEIERWKAISSVISSVFGSLGSIAAIM